MRSDVHVMQDGTQQLVQKGSRVLENVKWVHHDKVGYIFPEPATVNLSNQAETGRWSAITDQKNISGELVSEDVFALWFNHGRKPRGASYAYIVVPGVTEQVLSESSRNNRSVEILANTPALQAVRQGRLGISQAIFHQAGTLEAEKGVITISLDSPGIAMLKTRDGRLSELTLADPSRKLRRILVSVNGIYKGRGENYRTIVDEERHDSLFIVDLPQGVYCGKSVHLKIY